MIIELRNKIKSDLEAAFISNEMQPYMFITSFPDSKDSLEALQKEAKKYAEKGAIYIAYSSESPGERVSNVYTRFIVVFTIFIFSDNKETDEDIIKTYELVRDTLHKSFYLYYGEMAPIKNAATGLYMAMLQCGVSNIYQGVS